MGRRYAKSSSGWLWFGEGSPLQFTSHCRWCMGECRQFQQEGKGSFWIDLGKRHGSYMYRIHHRNFWLLSDSFLQVFSKTQITPLHYWHWRVVCGEGLCICRASVRLFRVSVRLYVCLSQHAGQMIPIDCCTAHINAACGGRMRVMPRCHRRLRTTSGP